MASSKRWGRGVRISATLEGGEELLKKLKGLGIDATAAADRATHAAMSVARDKIEADAPGPFIEMQRDDKIKGAGRAAYDVGPDTDHWFYQFFETGVQPFEIDMVRRRTKRSAIEKKSGKTMRGRKVRGEQAVMQFSIGGKEVFTRRVKRGGIPAQPFMRRNFLGSEEPMKDRFGDSIARTVIDKYVEG